MINILYCKIVGIEIEKKNSITDPKKDNNKSVSWVQKYNFILKKLYI